MIKIKLRICETMKCSKSFDIKYIRVMIYYLFLWSFEVISRSFYNTTKHLFFWKRQLNFTLILLIPRNNSHCRDLIDQKYFNQKKYHYVFKSFNRRIVSCLSNVYNCCFVHRLNIWFYLKIEMLGSILNYY